MYVGSRERPLPSPSSSWQSECEVIASAAKFCYHSNVTSKVCPKGAPLRQDAVEQFIGDFALWYREVSGTAGRLRTGCSLWCRELRGRGRGERAARARPRTHAHTQSRCGQGSADLHSQRASHQAAQPRNQGQRLPGLQMGWRIMRNVT